MPNEITAFKNPLGAAEKNALIGLLGSAPGIESQDVLKIGIDEEMSKYLARLGEKQTNLINPVAGIGNAVSQFAAGWGAVSQSEHDKKARQALASTLMGGDGAGLTSAQRAAIGADPEGYARQKAASDSAAQQDEAKFLREQEHNAALLSKVQPLIDSMSPEEKASWGTAFKLDPIGTAKSFAAARQQQLAADAQSKRELSLSADKDNAAHQREIARHVEAGASPELAKALAAGNVVETTLADGSKAFVNKATGQPIGAGQQGSGLTKTVRSKVQNAIIDNKNALEWLKLIDPAEATKYLSAYGQGKDALQGTVDWLSGGKVGDQAFIEGAQNFRSNAGDALAQYLRAMSGLAVSDKERVFLSQSFPSDKMTPTRFKAAHAAAVKRLNALTEAKQFLLDSGLKPGAEFDAELTQAMRDGGFLGEAATGGGGDKPGAGQAKPGSPEWLRENEGRSFKSGGKEYTVRNGQVE